MLLRHHFCFDFLFTSFFAPFVAPCVAHLALPIDLRPVLPFVFRIVLLLVFTLLFFHLLRCHFGVLCPNLFLLLQPILPYEAETFSVHLARRPRRKCDLNPYSSVDALEGQQRPTLRPLLCALSFRALCRSSLHSIPLRPPPLCHRSSAPLCALCLHRWFDGSGQGLPLWPLGYADALCAQQILTAPTAI